MSLVGFTRIGEYTLPTLTGTHSDFVAVLKWNDFNATVLSSLDDGGGDLRFSSDVAGTNQLPCHVVEFDKVANFAVVRVGPFSASSSTVIHVWGDNTGETQPAVGASFGRDEVYADYDWFYDGGDLTTDVTGKTAGATLDGFVTMVDDSYGKATVFNGNDAYVFTDSVGVLTSSTIGALVDNQTSGNANVFAHGDLSSARIYSFFNAANIGHRLGGSAARSAASALGVQNTHLTISSGNGRTLNDGSVVLADASYTGAAGSTTTGTSGVGAYISGGGASSDYFNGNIYYVYGSEVAKSDAFVADESDNSLSTTAWGSMAPVTGGRQYRKQTQPQKMAFNRL